MKRTLQSTLLLMLLLAWPAIAPWSAPSRFSDPQSIAWEDEAQADPARMAKIKAPATDTTVVMSEEEAVKQDTQIVSEDAVMPAEKPAAPRRDVTISEALGKEASGQTEEVGQERIEWVGKDRRIKRVQKVPGTIYLKSRKPDNKLIITDEYHHSNTELLGTADVRHYGARPEESTWTYSGSKFLCELRHPIPGFGYAVMKQGVSDPLQFLVEADGLIGGTGQARVQSRPPSWKRFTLVKDLGLIAVEPKDKVLFSVSSEWVRRLILEMREGMQPTISFWDDDTGGEDVVLTVSSFNFQKHLPEFSTCLGNLLPYSFKDVQKRTVYFGYDKYQLSEDQTYRLKKLIEYVKLDETVKKIDITGYSDSVGFARYNKQLAQRRANAVKKFLLAQGLPADKLVVKSKGEKGKKYNNRTESGRQKNRRVEVTLIK